jgi:hypothetical protein
MVDHYNFAVLFLAPDPVVTQWQDRFAVLFKRYFLLGFTYRAHEYDVHFGSCLWRYSIRSCTNFFDVRNPEIQPCTHEIGSWMCLRSSLRFHSSCAIRSKSLEDRRCSCSDGWPCLSCCPLHCSTVILQVSHKHWAVIQTPTLTSRAWTTGIPCTLCSCGLSHDHNRHRDRKNYPARED